MKVRKYTFDIFYHKLDKLRGYCLNETEDAIMQHSNMVKAINNLTKLVKYMNMAYVETEHIITLIWCSVTIISYFYLLTNLKNAVSTKRLKYIYKSIDLFEKVVLNTESESSTVIKIVIKYINDQKVWQTDQLCSYMISKLLVDTQRSVETITAVLDNIEQDFAIDDLHDAREKIACLGKAVSNFTWAFINIEMINRLLNIYYKVVMKSVSHVSYYLKRGLEYCIMTLMRNMTSDDILIIIDIVIDWVLESEASVKEPVSDFGNVVEQACRLHKCNLYWDTLKDKLLMNILKLVMSKKRLFCLLGHRLLQNIIDRHQNKYIFNTPKIFYMHMTYEIAVSQYHSEDKVFLKRYREVIHNCFIASIKNHGTHRTILESVYMSLALLTVEIPGGHTAASVSCIAMHIQEHALTLADNEADSDFMMSSHRCHAAVVSLMSLICWVCKAHIFYDYLNGVIMNRANKAPFLNPPVRNRYKYALHHMLWNEPDLFFEDWEVRYGLWKCFRRPKKIEDTLRLRWAY